ncbi:RNA polymerase sigma-70 factor [Chitinophaga sp. G-6-1-13]|uniref:RNA polymerase sigma-70 factor n=1 Tax=Chitinophaga fulva TaxID=2728842 RepID=A0A848GIS6_9BACT|nr:RNA polymerase sigma-70 factor [Chitinophaga fulva]NML37309.1 RNA polymerase sigma-70 factor [Chitinophaga fulva]
MLNDHNDDRLVEMCFKSYYQALHRYAYAMLKNNEEAGDAVQAVFLKIWEKRIHLIKDQGIRAYLYTAVHHHCLNIKRQQRTQEKRLADYREPGVININQLISKESYNRIMNCIDQLPEQCRLVFTKSRFEQKTYNQIAAELDISVKTVEVHMGKALRILRLKLSDILWITFLYNTFTCFSN